MKIGIEDIKFYIPAFYISLKNLAKKRNVNVKKYLVGLGQEKMSVVPPDENIVSMAANAASYIVNNKNKKSIGMVLFATESGIDQSKSAGIYVHSLLDLPKNCRILELKQACYSATGGLQISYTWLLQNPQKRVLILASDIARYGLGSPGESSQGAGAVAILLSNNPNIASIESGSGIYTSNIMDFWKPNYFDEALVEGKYSCKMYLKALGESWKDYVNNTKRMYQDHDQFIYHIPFPKMANKAHKYLQEYVGLNSSNLNNVSLKLKDSLIYSKQIGNCYSASLYLGLISLLDNSVNLSNQRIGCYSYGSGCVAEYFSLRVSRKYKKYLSILLNKNLLKKRNELDIKEYEKYYLYHSRKNNSPNRIFPKITQGRFRFFGIKDHKHIYGE